MSPETYAEWWKLHLRHARGEQLTPLEESVYQEGVAELDASEELKPNKELAQTRARLAALEAENARLSEKSRRLQSEIERLEAALFSPAAR